jgi:uncharacterized protein (TIGR03000 family)
MLQKAFSFGGVLVLAGAVVLGTAGPGWAAGWGGGARFGGARFGGARFGGARFGGARFGGYRGGWYGGYRGGYYRGGYYGYPRGLGYGYYSGYYPYLGFYPSTNYYPYFGNFPYYSNYYSDYGDYPYDSSSYPDYGSYETDPGWVAVSYAPGKAAQTTATPARRRSITRVTVRVPANAKLWFDGREMTTRGSVRRFKTPPLKAGQRYAYQVKARWKQNGRTVTQTRTVLVTPGKTTTIRFPVHSLTRGQTIPTKAKGNR